MALAVISDLTDFSDKTVLVRIDTDVEVENNLVLDDTRLNASLDTINYILQKGGTVVLLGHLGRPEGKYPIPNIQFPFEAQGKQISNEDKEFTLAPIAQWFGKYFSRPIQEVQLHPPAGGFSGWQITPKLSLLENLRFFKGEEANDPEFAKSLSGLGQLYVDDAFAVAHRDHASITGVAKLLPSYAGIHFAREIETLTQITQDPKRPLAVLIGGAKIETKLPLVEKMHTIADYVLVGGEIAEQDAVLIKVQHEKITPSPNGIKSAVLVAELTESKLDITPKSVENFAQIVEICSTIVWNGPVGLTGKDPSTEIGTKLIAEAILATPAYKVVGGGDTLAYLKKINLLDKFDFVSTGGGAMLELLAGKELPGVKVLEEQRS